MDTSFRLFPEAASSVAGRVDALYFFLVAVTAFFTFLICFLILYFGVKYRHGSRAIRDNPPTSVLMEVSWVVLLLALTMIMFVWGAWLFVDIQSPPPNAIEIDVVGKQWMWKVKHPQGRVEINHLHVPVGQPVQLRMISEDVIHSFYVPAFRVKQDVLPGYYTRLWFEATKVGEYHLFCAEYCGAEHSSMKGSVTVMEPGDYANWVIGMTGDPPEVIGERLFERHRCITCHKPDGQGNGPALAGVFGKQRPLQSGSAMLANDQYLRDSILNPQKHIVAGYQPLMPTFQGQLTESEVMNLIAYIKSLRGLQPVSEPPSEANGQP